MHRFGRVLGANAPELPYYVLQCAHFCQNRARRTGCDAPMRALLPESCAKNRLRRSDARTFARIAREEQVATLQCAHFCQNCARRTGCDAQMRAFLSESRAKNRLQRSNARTFARIAREERIARSRRIVRQLVAGSFAIVQQVPGNGRARGGPSAEPAAAPAPEPPDRVNSGGGAKWCPRKMPGFYAALCSQEIEGLFRNY